MPRGLVRLALEISLIAAWLLATSIAHARPEDPDIPVTLRPVHLTDSGDYLIPYMPVYRTTHDGRVGINFKSGIEFYLFAPERFGTGFHDSPEGPHMLAHDRMVYPHSNLHDSPFGVQGHTALCEAPNAEGKFENPYACGPRGDLDCYDLTLITATFADANSDSRHFWGTPVTVSVSLPKTPNASILGVAFGTPQAGITTFPFSQMFEPMVVQDGNLMIGRISNATITWTHSVTGEVITDQYDMVYLPAPYDPSRACDVTQWDEIKPLGHAPSDPEVNQRYGFALQPFRDGMGNLVSDRSDLAGSYPWIDSKGDNIGFSTLGTPVLEDEFPISCVPDRDCDDAALHEGDPKLMGKTIVGLWTRGKMVLLDNLVNNSDYSKLQTEDAGHRMLDMYHAGTRFGAGDGLARVGNGRDNTGPERLYGAPQNTSFLESAENKLNYWKAVRPVTPRDVVWHVSTGAGSDEFAFDDYLYPDTFVVSSMVQALRNDGVQITPYDGIGGNPARVQNGSGATPDRWLVPPYGGLVNARIERVALGGIHGKGLWLSGDAYVDYRVVAQPQDIRSVLWHFSLFVDTRFPNDEVVRVLITFPDGSELQLVGRDRVQYWNGNVVHTVALPHEVPDTGWAHLGLQMSAANQTAELYLDGFLLDRFEHDQPFFELSPGNLSVGRNPARVVEGFRGWIDDFKVIAHASGKEEWCNHAGGTLIGVGASGAWHDLASSHPDFSHQEISDFLAFFGKPTFPLYACYHDYSDDHAAHRANIPVGHTGVGASYNFPEGPLEHDQPRPDSSGNHFCRNCHTATGLQGLDLDALAFIPDLNAKDDPRRQPLQPYPRVHGNIPADWLGAGLPAEAMVAPPEGLAIDTLLLPEPGQGSSLVFGAALLGWMARRRAGF